MKNLSVVTALLAGAMAFAQVPDNSKINKRDATEQAVTPDKQSDSKADMDLLQKIRREITKSETLSTYAKNVKIVTRDGVVHLRGPVKTAEEKQAIETIAKRLAGDANVQSHLEVVPEK